MLLIREGFALSAARALVLAALMIVPAEAGKYSSGGGRSYSSGGGSSFSRPSAPSRPSGISSGSSGISSSRPSFGSGGSGGSAPRQSYSSGGSSPFSTSGFSTPSAPAPAPRPKPAPSTFDAGAARARQVEISQQNFLQSTQPAPVPPPPTRRATYTSRPPVAAPALASAPPVSQVRSPVLNVYRNRPVVIYRDSYSSLFWWWLLDQPRPVRAAWIYNHNSSMDPARQAALIAADPPLQQEVASVAATSPVADPNYTPPGLESPDDMKAEPVAANVAVVENPPSPAPTPVNGATSGQNQTIVPLPSLPLSHSPRDYDPYDRRNSTRREGSSSVFPIMIFLTGMAATIWLVFFKRWKIAAA